MLDFQSTEIFNPCSIILLRAFEEANLNSGLKENRVLISLSDNFT